MLNHVNCGLHRFFHCCLLLLLTGGAVSVRALTITNYDPAVHDRFASGFPSAPLDNLNPGYIGAGLDISGVGWSTTTYVSSSFKAFALLSPRHFLTAQHYETTSNNLRTQGIRIKDANNVVRRVDGVTGVTGLGYGLFLEAANGQQDYDLGIGALADPIAPNSEFSRLAVLDLNSGSSTDSPSAYSALPFFLYGRSGTSTGSPRIAATTPDLVTAVNSDPKQDIIRTTHADAAFVSGDSGAPAVHAWLNPNGLEELSVLGVNTAVDNTNGFNFVSFLPTAGAITAAQGAMNPDGYALRLVGNPSNTWVGSSSTRIDRNSAWGLGGNPNSSGATSDKYVLFDPATASSFSPSVDTNYNLRGLYFKNSAIGSGFSFVGGSTLTIGRGGLTNYDTDTQNFANPLALGAPQYWSIESGAVQLVNLNTNGHLLEIGGGGLVVISGNISGAGSLALSEGQLTLSGSSSYTGTSWVHGGTLQVDGDISSSGQIMLSPWGSLSGSGTVPQINGSGTVAPGNSPGILTSPQIDPAAGLQFDFTFTSAGLPDFSQPTNSINDVLRLTADPPILSAMSPVNRIRIFLDVDSLTKDLIFSGGFFTDHADDFLPLIEGAVFEIYVADADGSVSHQGQSYAPYIDGPVLFALSTTAQTADFGSGPVNGRILQLTTSADLSNYQGWKLSFDLSGDAALDDADEDGDGLSLLLEYALGGDPTVNSGDSRPEIALTPMAESAFLELIVTRPKGLQGIAYIPQTTADLNNWPSDATGILNPEPEPVDNADGTETLTYRRADPIESSEKAFIRLKIENLSP